MENKIKIVTPEGVNIHFEIAGIGSRFVALFLDTLIQTGLFVIILFSFVGAGITLEDTFDNVLSWYTAVLILIAFIVYIGYFVFFEMIMRGRTPGKAALKLRTIKNNGQPVSFVASVLRNLFRFADVFPGLYAVGIIVMFVSEDCKRVGDYVAGTIVVKEYASRLPMSMIDDLKTKEQRVNTYPLSSEEYHLLKEFLSRKDQLTPHKRVELSQQLCARFFDKFHIPLEERKDEEKFLEMLVEMNRE
jgi:uncharacterized RDD family membrane protein YckC